jgi:hypothetical protein
VRFTTNFPGSLRLVGCDFPEGNQISVSGWRSRT